MLENPRTAELTLMISVLAPCYDSSPAPGVRAHYGIAGVVTLG